jgi:hypothetical protein
MAAAAKWWFIAITLIRMRALMGERRLQSRWATRRDGANHD